MLAGPVIAGMVSVKFPAFGVVGPWSVSVPVPPEPLKTIAPVLLEAVPSVSAFAPVNTPVPPCTVAVVVMLLPVEIVPKPDAIEPTVRAPTLVRLEYVRLESIAAFCNRPVPEMSCVLL